MSRGLCLCTWAVSEHVDKVIGHGIGWLLIRVAIINVRAVESGFRTCDQRRKQIVRFRVGVKSMISVEDDSLYRTVMPYFLVLNYYLLI